MKKTSVSAFLAVILFSFVTLLTGCSWSFFDQPGETAAEGHRRHIRNLHIQRQELIQDIDYVLLTDQASKLSPSRVP